MSSRTSEDDTSHILYNQFYSIHQYVYATCDMSWHRGYCYVKDLDYWGILVKTVKVYEGAKRLGLRY